MARKSELKPKLTDVERHKRFVEMAREVEADETIEGGERAFRKVVSAATKPKPSDRA